MDLKLSGGDIIPLYMVVIGKVYLESYYRDGPFLPE